MPNNDEINKGANAPRTRSRSGTPPSCDRGAVPDSTPATLPEDRLPNRGARSPGVFRGPRLNPYRRQIPGERSNFRTVKEVRSGARCPQRPSSFKRKQFCKYHGSYGHATENCQALRYVIEGLLPNGRPHKRPPETLQSDGSGDELSQLLKAMMLRDSAPEDKLPVNLTHPPQTGRGPHEGRLCERRLSARERAEGRSYGTSGELFPTRYSAQEAPPKPEDDLVVRADVEGHEVRRILVNTGSSVDIIYLETLDRIGIPRRWIKPSIVPLTGLTGHQAPVLGKVFLKVTIGDDRRQQITTMVRFTVVDLKTPYNATLGRPFLRTIKASVIPYCQTMKFPTKNGEGHSSSG